MHWVTQVKPPPGFKPGSPDWEADDLPTELSLPPCAPLLFLIWYWYKYLLQYDTILEQFWYLYYLAKYVQCKKLMSYNHSFERYIQWNHRWESTVTRDQHLIRDHCFSSIALHFYTFVTAMKDHLSNKTTFYSSMG